MFIKTKTTFETNGKQYEYTLLSCSDYVHWQQRQHQKKCHFNRQPNMNSTIVSNNVTITITQ